MRQPTRDLLTYSNFTIIVHLKYEHPILNTHLSSPVLHLQAGRHSFDVSNCLTQAMNLSHRWRKPTLTLGRVLWELQDSDEAANYSESEQSEGLAPLI